MKISYILPSRSRPDKLFDCLFNIRDLSISKNYEIICAFDEDDQTMNNEEARERLKEHENVKYFYGFSGGKVAACNREAARITEDTDILCLHSDDMNFLSYGFDDEIREAFKNHCPNLDGIIHFPDGHQSNTMTYTIMGINLFKQLGYLYNPIYRSVFADNELTEMCRAMFKYTFIDKNILIHAHPIFNLCEWDELYRLSESPENYTIDGATYKKRKENNFGL